MSKFFDRNSSSKGWNQDLIQNQKALVLGVGGLGNSLCLALCRLGFKKITVIDKDVVEASNLNRQILFSQEDVGKNKIDCAKKSLQSQHNISTKIEALHLCALQNWDTIVEIAKDCTCIFNTIDHGDYFDHAVSSLARSLKI